MEISGSTCRVAGRWICFREYVSCGPNVATAGRWTPASSSSPASGITQMSRRQGLKIARLAESTGRGDWGHSHKLSSLSENHVIQGGARERRWPDTTPGFFLFQGQGLDLLQNPPEQSGIGFLLHLHSFVRTRICWPTFFKNHPGQTFVRILPTPPAQRSTILRLDDLPAIMAPTQSSPWVDAAKRSAIAAVPELTRASAHIMLSRRALTVDDTQKVTLGVRTIQVH